MKALARVFSISLSGSLLFFLGACAGSNPAPPNPASVTLNPSSPQQITSGQTINITATVTGGSGSNQGVTWSLNGAGSLANVNSTSVTYQSPSGISAPAEATITATAVADTTKSASLSVTVNAAGNSACGSGNESKLKGSYAFLLQGFNGQSYVAVAGQFTADGAGKITAGQEDVDTVASTTGAVPLQVNAANSSYTLGSDDRGCLTLATSSGSTMFRFAAGSSNGTVFTNGRLLEFDNTNGMGQSTAGIFRLQDPTAFSNSKFTGNFAFGGSGVNSAAQRFVIAGVLNLSSGLILGGTADADDGGMVLSDQSLSTGAYTIDGATGRGTFTFALGGAEIHFASYVISSSEAIVVTTDPLTASNPIAAGEAELQSSTFSQSSLNGNIVLHDTGLAPNGPLVVLGLLSADGVSNISGPTFNNVAGTSGSPMFSESYTVAANGRVTVTGGTTPPVFYIYGKNEGFEIGTGSDSSFGFLENQAAGPFTNASFSGAYFLGPEDPASAGIQMDSGAIVANGSATSPSITGTLDGSGLLGLSPGEPFAASYSMNSNGTGSITVNGAPATNVVIAISPTKLVFFENGVSRPVISVVEQ